MSRSLHRLAVRLRSRPRQRAGPHRFNTVSTGWIVRQTRGPWREISVRSTAIPGRLLPVSRARTPSRCGSAAQVRRRHMTRYRSSDTFAIADAPPNIAIVKTETSFPAATGAPITWKAVASGGPGSARVSLLSTSTAPRTRGRSFRITGLRTPTCGRQARASRARMHSRHGYGVLERLGPTMRGGVRRTFESRTLLPSFAALRLMPARPCPPARR